jgi:hypothetical protein
VAEPAANHIHVDARFQEMDGGRVTLIRRIELSS